MPLPCRCKLSAVLVPMLLATGAVDWLAAGSAAEPAGGWGPVPAAAALQDIERRAR
ncbi:MAG: hypothetical protein R6X25_07415 [Candidatus Krumholzibacteriia bacterium]